MRFNLLSKILNNLEKIFRKYFPKRIPNASLYINTLKGLSGLEIGGPSFAFSKKGFIPIYKHIKTLDGCNFSAETVWEGKIKPGKTYQFENKVGYQYIMDGSNLSEIKENKYDFILSSHNLEHIANPIKALFEWKRVIKINGYMLLIVPHKDKTFDNKRPITKFNHIVDDFEKKVSEKDDTHFNEIILLHDIEKDLGVTSLEELKTRTLNNYENRCAHHHTFNCPLVAQMLDYIDMKIIDVIPFSPFHIIALAQKTEKSEIKNEYYTSPSSEKYKSSIFPSDRLS